MNIATCAGIISQDANGNTVCSTGWQQSVLAVPFDPSTLDPLLIAGAVGTGFFILVPVWAAALGVKYLLKFIN